MQNRARLLFLCVALCPGLIAAADTPKQSVASPEAATASARYVVRLTDSPIQIDSLPNDEAWARAERAEIDQFPWSQHELRPQTTVRALYNATHLYLLFECREKYLHASHTQYQSPVFRDNCVELFASPSEDLSRPYLNFEFNCLGALLLQCGYELGGRTNAPLETARRVRCKATFEEPVDLQDESVKTWRLEAAIPFSLFVEMAGAEPPQSGSVWRGNFNKCSTSTKEKHWATWARVGTPRPHFHKPEYFGRLVFE